MRASNRAASSDRWRGFVLAAAALALLAAGAASAQVPAFCEAELIDRSGDDLGYQPRGGPERCEGRYASPVSGSSLTVGSLEMAGSKPPVEGEALALAWGNVANARLRLHVRSLKPKVFYRLDAAPTAPPFSWSTGLMRDVGVAAADLGVLAVADFSLADLPVYVPLRFAAEAAGQGGQGRSLRLVVVPEKRVDALYLTVATLSAEGEEVALLKDQEKQRGEFYAAGRAVKLDLPVLPGVDRYRVEVGARLTGGGSANREFVVLLPDE